MGFEDPEVLGRHPFGLEDGAAYPLFTPDLVDLMRRLLSPERQKQVATVMTVRAIKPL